MRNYRNITAILFRFILLMPWPSGKIDIKDADAIRQQRRKTNKKREETTNSIWLSDAGLRSIFSGNRANVVPASLLENADKKNTTNKNRLMSDN
jgi:hypothetical protein